VSHHLLQQEDFPDSQFFSYLKKGIEHYQLGNFQRAIWEWFSASRLNITEPVHLSHKDRPIELKCDLHDVSLLLFFYVIYLNNLSGVAQLRHPDFNQSIVFKNGLLCSLENIDQEKRIGKYIMERKKEISYDDMKKYIIESRKNRKKVGEFMLEKKIVNKQELQDILAQQVQEIASDMFSVREGEALFTQKEIKEKTYVAYAPLKLAFKSAQRRFDVDKFRNEITDNKAIFRKAPHLGELEDKLKKKLNTNELFILSLIDGFRNIDQLVRFSGANEESIVSILYRLSKIGLIRKTRESAEYEDKEFEEVSKILDLLFEMYKNEYFKLYRVLGRKTNEIINDAKNFLDLEKQKLFTDTALDDPERMEKKTILSNMAVYYPDEEKRFLFIDIFGELFDRILYKTNQYLGKKITQSMINDIKKTLSNIESLSVKTNYSKRLTKTFENLLQKHA